MIIFRGDQNIEQSACNGKCNASLDLEAMVERSGFFYIYSVSVLKFESKNQHQTFFIQSCRSKEDDLISLKTEKHIYW